MCLCSLIICTTIWFLRRWALFEGEDSSCTKSSILPQRKTCKFRQMFFFNKITYEGKFVEKKRPMGLEPATAPGRSTASGRESRSFSMPGKVLENWKTGAPRTSREGWKKAPLAIWLPNVNRPAIPARNIAGWQTWVTWASQAAKLWIPSVPKT